MIKKLFWVLCLVGLLYTASCMHSCYRYFVPAQSGRHQQKQSALPTPPPWSRHGSSSHDSDPLSITSPEVLISGLNDEPSRPDSSPLYMEEEHVYEPTYSPLTETLCAPGLLVLGALGLAADNTLLWLLAILVDWWTWGMSVRLLWLIPARLFGFGYNPEIFRYLLWLTPPWRPFYSLIRPVLQWLRFFSFGRSHTDKWESFIGTIWQVYRRGHIFLGRACFLHLPLYLPVGIRSNRPIAVIAAQGAGKTTQIVTMVSLSLKAKANCFVTDCDGQILEALRPVMASQSRDIYKFGLPNLAPSIPVAAWDVIGETDDYERRYGRDAVVECAAIFGEAFVRTTPGVNEWVYSQAREFAKSCLLYTRDFAPPGQRNLLFFRRMLTLGAKHLARPQDNDAFLVLLADMMTKPDYDGAIAAGASMLKRSLSQVEGRSAPLAELISQTGWLDFDYMKAIVTRTGFQCHDLKAGACVFITLPLPSIQGIASGFVRGLTVMCMHAAQRARRERKNQGTLYILDEFPHLGRLEIAETTAGGGRKYGQQLVLAAQNIGQIKRVYPNSYGEFLGACESVLWMENGDNETLKFLSDTLGSATRTERVPGNWPFSIAPRHQKQNIPLLTLGQLREYLHSHVVVTRANQCPMRLARGPYYTELPVTWYEADSFHGDTPARAFTRRLLAFFKGRKAQPSRRKQTPKRKEHAL